MRTHQLPQQTRADAPLDIAEMEFASAVWFTASFTRFLHDGRDKPLADIKSSTTTGFRNMPVLASA